MSYTYLMHRAAIVNAAGAALVLLGPRATMLEGPKPVVTEELRSHVRGANRDALIVEAASPVMADDAARVTGRRVLVVEDGPTLTHGQMRVGAGTVLARKFGAAEIVDPRPFAVGSIAATYATYPAIGRLLAAMGYGHEQVRELEQTIARVPCDVVVVGMPIDLRRLVRIEQPVERARYERQEIGRPNLSDALAGFLRGSAARHR